MKRRAIVIGLVVVALLVAGGVSLLERALQPCEPLDIQLQRSGCIRVIELPDGLRIHFLHASNVGNQLAVLVSDPKISSGAQEVLIFSTETWTILDRLPLLEVEIEGDVRAAADKPPYYRWNTTQLARGIFPRIDFSDVRIPEGSVYALVREPRRDQVQFFDSVTNELINTFEVPIITRIALSHDERRFLAGLSDGRIAAWDVRSGELIFTLFVDYRFWPVNIFDWLADNQTIVVALSYRSRLGLFRVP